MARSKTSIARGLLTGGAVVNDKFLRRLPVVIFGALLMMIYIAIGFRVQSRHNNLEQITTQIKELRTISVATTALRTELTRRENVERMLREKNITLVVNPSRPVIIE